MQLNAIKLNLFSPLEAMHTWPRPTSSHTLLRTRTSFRFIMSLNMKTFSDLAVAQQCRIYGEIMAELNIPGVPNEQEFYDLVQAKIHGTESPFNHSRHAKMASTDFLEDSQTGLAASPRSFDNRAGATNFKLTSKDIKSKPLIHKTSSTDENGDTVESSVTLEFPFLHGVDYSSTCQSLKCSGGLLTPCLTRPSKGSNFCKGCVKPGKDGSTVLSKYGTVTQREACSMMCYTDSKDKKEIGFGTYCAKRDVTRAQAEALIQSAFGGNVILPEEYWSVDKAKASRAVKKTVSVSSDDEASVAEAEEPAKVVEAEEPAKVVEEPAKVAEEPASPVEEPASPAEEPASPVEEPASSVSVEKELAHVAEELSHIQGAKPSSPTNSTVSTGSDGSANKKKRGRPKKAKPAAQEELEKPESPKKGRGRPKKSETVVVVDHAENKAGASEATGDEEDFTTIQWEGVSYLLDDENTMFLMMDDEPELYGTWDPETKKATPLE